MLLAESWSTKPFALLDGGLATELERCGCDLDDPLWSAKVLLDQPDRVVEVHRAWLDAGADVITTASYQATIPGLVAHGLDAESARAVLRRSVDLAKQAVRERGRGLVAASVGSFGATLADGSEYRGGYGVGRDALIEFHAERVAILAERADVLAFETIPAAVEVQAIAAVLDQAPGPPAWVSLSVAGDPPRLADGTEIAEALLPLHRHPRVAAIGVNCLAPNSVSAALRVIGDHVEVPLVAYPNSGERWIDRQWAGHELSAEAFAELALDWHSLGARLIGGCCRTRPDHLLALGRVRERLVAMQSPATLRG